MPDKDFPGAVPNNMPNEYRSVSGPASMPDKDPPESGPHTSHIPEKSTIFSDNAQNHST
jgi:hypothetical protein